MSRNAVVLAAGAAALVALGAAGGAWWAHRTMPAAGAEAANAPAAGRKVLYWQDPMVPGRKFDKPGKSPYMVMDLVPVYADDSAPAAGVKVDARLAESAYAGGRADLASVLDARRAVLEARLGAIAAEAELARAWAQLAFLVPERTQP